MLGEKNILSPPSQGVKMALTLTSPHHKLPLSFPFPKELYLYGKPGPKTFPEFQGEARRGEHCPLWMEGRCGRRLALKSRSMR